MPTEQQIKAEWQAILEKDDRTSPEEYPDMALITFDEFRTALLAAEGKRDMDRLEYRRSLGLPTTAGFRGMEEDEVSPAAESGVTEAMLEAAEVEFDKFGFTSTTSLIFVLRAALTAALQAGGAATELLGQKPGERAAQGTPADAKAGETSPSNSSRADAPAKVAEPA